MGHRIVAALAASALVVAAACGPSPTGAPATSRPHAGTAPTTVTPAATPPTGTVPPGTTMPPTTAAPTTAITPPVARPELTTTIDARAPWDAYQRSRAVLRTVFEPYGRWAFSGIPQPVVGDCFRGRDCPFDLGDLLTPEARAALADRAARADVDPVSCTTGAVLLAPARSGPFIPGATLYGSWNGETVEEPIRVEMDAATLRISAVVCSVLNPVGAGGALPPPPAAPTGTRHTTGEALALVWDLFVLDDEVNLTACLDAAPCELDLAAWFDPACLAELRRQARDVHTMSSVITGSQNTTRIVGRSGLRVVGRTLSVDADTWWGFPIRVTVDLDRLLVASLEPDPPAYP